VSPSNLIEPLIEYAGYTDSRLSLDVIFGLSKVIDAGQSKDEQMQKVSSYSEGPRKEQLLEDLGMQQNLLAESHSILCCAGKDSKIGVAKLKKRLDVSILGPLHAIFFTHCNCAHQCQGVISILE